MPEAVTELPGSKPELVAAQIHGGDDDVLQIRLEGNKLMVQYADGKSNRPCSIRTTRSAPRTTSDRGRRGTVEVSYNGKPKAELPLSGSGWYFKAGAYVQSNPSKGDAADAAGQVIIYKADVKHS